MSFTLEQIKGMLQINKHRLDDELEQQAQITYEISDKVSLASKEVAELKESMEATRAAISIELRTVYEKATISEVDSKIAVNSNYRGAFIDWQDAKREHEQWAGLLEAWRAKGFALKTLADLHMANYYAVNSGGKEREYSSNREVHAQTRVRRRVVV